MKLLNETALIVLALLSLAGNLPKAGVLQAAEAATSDATAIMPEVSGELFLPSDDALADVASAIDAASKSGRLVLVVMGANWCHDSRALAARFYQEPLQEVIASNYETVFVDVGYLDRGREVINSIGPPVYYATPTVLIVDPVNGRLVNADNRHQWGNADSIAMDESVEYFRLMAAADGFAAAEPGTNPVELQELLDEITAFEQLQAARLYRAYAVVGPLLQAYKAGEQAENFEGYWNEVRDFRMKVPMDVDHLRTQARERFIAGDSNIELEYPVYPAFTWE